MKKTLLTSILLVFALSLQVQAVNTNPNQGSAKPSQAVPPAQGTTTGKAVKAQEKNKVMNKGEDNQIQTQEQNSVEAENGKTEKSNSGKSTSNPSSQKRSEVANAVQAMLRVADRDGGIGSQVRIIAQNQNKNNTKLESNVENIFSRGSFAKFFVGPNYKEIKDAQKTLEQNREQIRELNQIRTQLSNEGDQTMLQEQIRILEGANLEIETILTEAKSGFSLFGWLNNMIS